MSVSNNKHTKWEELVAELKELNSRLDTVIPLPQDPDWNEQAFKWHQKKGFEAIPHCDQIELNDLLFVDRQKHKLRDNTLKLIQGKPANHTLLWGARGTGKSSLIKAIFNDLTDNGLRIIEVDREDLRFIHKITRPLYGRAEKFILYTDDLSFEEDDPGYKTLKAALDGSLSQQLDNVLIYATSNRRHLLPERMSDNLETKMVEGELHFGDAVEEKISLAERFGLWLSFHPMKQQQYLAIVEHWNNKLGCDIEDLEVFQQAALQYALLRGSRSGRIARQFINDYVKPD